MPLPSIEPPLLNSANPWATSEDDLKKLYDCPYTGAITTRTCLLTGFAHDDAVHQYTFFDPRTHEARGAGSYDTLDCSPSGAGSLNTLDCSPPGAGSLNSLDRSRPGTGSLITLDRSPPGTGSLNTLGYSPLPLSQYLSIIAKIADKKPCIVSVTGSSEAVVECHRRIAELAIDAPLCMEVNLSCPNIPDKPPPAYSKSSLLEYLRALRNVHCKIPIGLKTPPYTYHDQFKTLIEAIVESGCPVDFITATNTLGSSLVLDGLSPAIASASGAGIGGMAGAPLHPLALGNVKILRSMLDEHGLGSVDIIGVGGVCDKASFDRMRSVGAKVVGVGTALGVHGLDIFGRILRETAQSGAE